MEFGVTKGTLVKLTKGDLTNTIARVICFECNREIGIQRGECNCGQTATVTHVKQNIRSKQTLSICIEDPCKKIIHQAKFD